MKIPNRFWRFLFVVACVLTACFGVGVHAYADEEEEMLSRSESAFEYEMPQITAITNYSEGLSIKWNSVPGAALYRIYRRMPEETSWKKLVNVSKNSYVDLSVEEGITYLYTVCCISSTGKILSDYDKEGTPAVFVSPVSITDIYKASAGVVIKWTENSAADGYYIYRKIKGGSFSKLKTIRDASTIAFTDTSVEPGKEYSYRLYAVSNGYRSVVSEIRTIVPVSSPTLLSACEDPDGTVTIRWEPVQGAVKYRVYRKKEGASWAKLKDVSDTSCRYSNAAGVDYIYTVRCLSGDGIYTSWYDTVGIRAEKNNGVPGTTITSIAANSNGITMKWKSSAQADHYLVQKSSDGRNWTSVYQPSAAAGASYTDTSARKGTISYYRVAVCKGSSQSDFSEAVHMMYLETPKLTGLSYSFGGPVLTWEEVPGALKYRVYRKVQNGSWTKLKDVTGHSYTDSKAELGTVYFYTVRCLSDDGTICSSWYDTVGKSICFQEPLEQPGDMVGFQIFYDRQYAPIENQPHLLTAETFLAQAKQTSAREIRCAVNRTAAAEDILLLRFIAQAQKECSHITVRIDDSYSGTLLLPASRSDFYIPISGVSSIRTVAFQTADTSQIVSIGNVELVNYGKTDVKRIKTGRYDLTEDAFSNVIPETDGIGFAGTDIVTDGKFLYTVYKGTLCVYETDGAGGAVLSGILKGLGNSRDIAFSREVSLLAVSARESGVYFVDIADPYRPKLIGNLETLEMATGIEIVGKYCFISNRNFGVEIYDISHPENPVFCSQVYNNDEYYDCTVSDGYLYVSAWAQQKVHIYSLSDISNPKLIRSIDVNGNAGGCTVDNHILYVATGYHNREDHSALTSPGYGMGNGMELYDVSDPANPVWMSGAGIDGRYLYSGFDHWRVNVSGSYAYLASTYNGVYVFDISNPKAPVRVGKAVVSIPKTSARYSNISGDRYIYGFDIEEEIQGITTNVAVLNGYMYFATYNGQNCSVAADADGYVVPKQYKKCGLYSVRVPGAVYAEKTAQNLGSVVGERPKQQIVLNGYRSQEYYDGFSVYAVTGEGSYIYAAGGSKGIGIYDRNMKLIRMVATKGAVKDLKISNGYLYAAESDQGLGVYRIEGSGLYEAGRCTYNAYNTVISQLCILGDGSHILVQAGWFYAGIINVEDPENPIFEERISTGSMYYRNLSTGLVKGQYGCIAEKNGITWYQETGGQVSVVKKFTNPFYSEKSGTAVKGDKALTIYKNGYVVYNPLTVTQNELNALPVIKIPGISTMTGKPVIYGDVLIVSYNYGRKVTMINVKDINKPELIGQFTVNGNPDIAFEKDSKIYIPLGHDGLMVLTKA